MQTYQLGQYGTVTDYTEEREGPGVPPVHFDKWAYIGDTKERVLAVYRDVWDEFYNWEQVECTDKIKELLSSGSPDSKHHQDLEPCEVDTEADTSISSSSYSIMIHDENGAVSCTRVSAETLPLNPSIDPHPRYQMCTPISRSIFWEQDALDEEQSVRFFPYADEDRWNIVEYLDEFESSPLLVWDDMTDPDHDMIHLQAVTILLRGRNPLSLEDIETVKVFPGETLRGTASGVLWSCAQRDQFLWSGNSLQSFEPLSPLQAPKSEEIEARVRSVLRQFCFNLNCVQPLCSVHVDKGAELSLPPPKIKRDMLRLTEGDPCDRDCFRNVDDNFIDQIDVDRGDTASWDVLKTFPDLVPCELAVICRKPCREVFALRWNLFPDHCVKVVEMEPIKQKPPPKAFFSDLSNDDQTPKFTPLRHACDHPGSCSDGCPCFDSKMHCQRTCVCGDDCHLRWKGCKCKGNGTGTKCKEKCPCRAQKRECSPELCKPCGARKAIAGESKYCSNVEIQRDRPAVLEVKGGLVGLGAFAMERIKQNQYLGEYVGEGYHEEEPETSKTLDPNAPLRIGARAYIREYTGLNYLFDLNSSRALDADTIGNSTRYFNHSTTPNTTVVGKLVNNEHRLGFFATNPIPKGKELFLDYGDNYWIGKAKPV